MDTTGRYDDAGASAGRADRAATTLAAAFADREQAHDTARRLHDEGFRDTWIGLTRSDDAARYDAPEFVESRSGDGGAAPTATPAGETRVESENWFTRFFGDGDESLSDALIRHGVSAAEARSAGPLPPHSAILTVEGANHPELAAQIIAQSGGRLITSGLGATGFGTSGTYAGARFASQAPAPRTTTLNEDAAGYDAASTAGISGVSDISPAGDRVAADAANARPRMIDRDAMTGDLVPDRGADNEPTSADSLTSRNAMNDIPLGSAAEYDDYGRYRGGDAIDESTRLQLREERLRVDKSRIASGEATVGTEVVTQTHDIDVPVVREQLFIERRSSSESTVGATEIGGNTVIRVPLSEERVVVSKEPVVTEEVVVGKREVHETQHISETTRKEQLDVTDPRSAVGETSASRPV